MSVDEATESDARIEVLIVDMNGRLRGKQLPIHAEKKVWSGAVRLPTSTQSLDIWGYDNDEFTGLSMTIGDPDGTLVADPRTLVAMPWAPAGSKQVFATVHELDGSPSFMDPRSILGAVIDRFTALGLTPVVATELEFYVLAGDWREHDAPSAPTALTYRGEPNGFQLYDMDAVDLLGAYLETLRGYARAQGLPAEATTAEFGPGQFEVNLQHRPDALAAADDCVALKRVAEQAARRHSLKSTCMAKPYTDHAGSGLHVHASVLDAEGRNILDAQGGEPTRLKSVCAGLLQTLRDAQLVFAPFANSYRRFQPGSFAPTDLTWGIGHRGTAVRIPEQDGPGARIEHRVAGADANPHLMLAAILGGMLLGLQNDLDPGAETTPGHTPADAPALTHDFLTAAERFRASSFIADVFGEKYRKLYGDTKRKEALRYLHTVSDFDYRTYLPRV